jgi:hypothetical protein
MLVATSIDAELQGFGESGLMAKVPKQEAQLPSQYGLPLELLAL